MPPTLLAPTRRGVLTLGGLAPLGLGLTGLLAREAAAAPAKRRPAKSCLLLFLEGGPSHLDLWDMKPYAPAEIRGTFRPIASTVPGTTVCEHLPLLAGQMHRLAQVRSVTHGVTDHNAGTYYALTGHPPYDGPRLVTADGPKNVPPFGAVLAKERPTGRPLPDFVQVGETMWNNGTDIAGQSAGFLGAAYDPFVTGDPSLPDFRVPGLGDAPAGRLRGRAGLLAGLDGALGRLADDPAVGRLDRFRRRAWEMVTAPAVRRAFDLSAEPRSVRERYGVDRGSDRSVEARKFGGLPHLGQCLLLGRRLVEAGVRLVTVVSGRRIDQAWDTHRQHFGLLERSLLPPFDRAFSALLEDMHQRGLLDETLVVVLSEFGRTPKMGRSTSNAGTTPDGRDHWPYCYTVMFAGAGVPGGLVYGASDRTAAHPSRDPVRPEDVAATVYALMGVPADAELRDPQGRPMALVRGRAVGPVLG